jgi:hypothetical protein
VADATGDVPVRLEYVAQIAANARTPEAQYVAILMNNPLRVGAVQAGLAVFWWDPLAAFSVTDHMLVHYEWNRVTVIQDGVSSGRHDRDANRRVDARGLSADTALFETTMLDVLNGVANS